MDSESASAERSDLFVAFHETLIEEIVNRVLQRLGETKPSPEPYIGVEDAAAYLACKPGRIYALTSAQRIPHHKDGSRLLFKRSELDVFVAAGGAVRQ
jgi:excisionase family DNA binding protein